MHLFDHTNTRWRSRYQRVNGAETYSMDLVKYQLGNWEKVLVEDDILSTCPLLSEVDLKGRYRRAVQYLHTAIPHAMTTKPRAIVRALRNKAEHVTFLSACSWLARALRRHGMDAH